MYFQHSSEIWRDFPELVPGVLFVEGVNATATVDDAVAGFSDIAKQRLAAGPESELFEISAWRSAFSKMGLKPTQYRCASESLLRRIRKEGSLPRINPLIDLCNSISIAFAIPMAVFDVSQIVEFLEVRYASGNETYATLSGEIETPNPGEVIFADAAGRAHARRWTNRQSGTSVVRGTTNTVLIVAEALHETAVDDVARLMAAISNQMNAVWAISPKSAIVTSGKPRFEFEPAASVFKSQA